MAGTLDRCPLNGVVVLIGVSIKRGSTVCGLNLNLFVDIFPGLSCVTS